MDATPSLLRLVAAVLVGLWLAATVIAILHSRQRSVATTLDREPVKPPIARKSGLNMLPDAMLSPTVFNLTSLPIWWVDRNFRLAGANDAYARAVGHPTAEGAVRAGAELAPHTRGLAVEARETDRAVVGEERVTINGERRLLEIIAIPLKGGEVAHLALDETRRHAAHSAAALQARALGEALDRLQVAVALFDGLGMLRHHNEAFARMFALDRQWLETRPELDRVFEAMRAADRLPEERDFARWRAERRAWISSPLDRIEEQWTLPGGTLLHVAILPRGGDGPLLIFEDDTERALLAATRDQLLSVHAAMLDHLREGVAVFGPDGRLRFFNRRFADIVIASPAELAAHPGADELMERLAKLLDEPERAKRLRGLIVGATAGRTAGEGRANSSLGYTVDYSAFPLPDGNALITCTVIASANAEDG